MNPPHDPSSNSPAAAPPLADLGWLATLARELVRDAHAADDALQDAVLASLRAAAHGSRPGSPGEDGAGPGEGRGARSWWAALVRNAHRQARRSEGRRALREAQVARPDALPSAAELTARVEQQRRLVEAILGLEEPLRSTVVLRYLDGAPPRRIAAAHGVPVATVKSRLQRALARLREALDRDGGGDGRTWIAALLPLLRWPGVPLAAGPTAAPDLASAAHGASLAPAVPAAVSTWTLGLGAFLVNAKILIPCLLAAAGLLFALVWRNGPASPRAASAPTRGEATPAVALPAPRQPEAPRPAPTSDSQRTIVAQPAAAPKASATTPAEGLEGLVFDASGSALPDLAVRPRGMKTEARSDEQGRFRFDKRSGDPIEVAQPGWTTVLAGSGEARSRASVVVAARALELAGRVADAYGAPVESARVHLRLPPGFRGRFPVAVDESQDCEVQASADEQGRFRLAEVPAVERAWLDVAAKGFLPARVDLPAASDVELLVTLQRPEVEEGSLLGLVVDEFGQPVEGALVAWGQVSAESRADGRFTFAASQLEEEEARVAREGRAEPRDMVAVRAGALPGRVHALPGASVGLARWPDPLVITLGGAPLSIRGRVLDPRGLPRPDVRVWANGLTYLGQSADASERDRDMTFIENRMAGNPSGFQFVKTDPNGAFEIAGLLDREYDLTAIDDDTIQRVDLPAVAAGLAGVELRFRDGDLLEKVTGRVVDRSGAGIPNVNVRVTTDVYSQGIDGHVSGVWMESGATAQSGADGRFTLRGVASQRTYLRFSGETVLAGHWMPPPSGWPVDEASIEVALVRRCHFQVELAAVDLADGCHLLDAAGNRLQMTEYQGGGSMSSDRMGLREGHSSTLAASEDATTLVLLRGEEEVRRLPVHLTPGELTILKP